MEWKEASYTYMGSEASYTYMGSEEEENDLADPQSFLYFSVMFSMAGLLYFPLLAAPYLPKNKNQTPFDSYFMMMTIASVSMAVLASCILIFASFFLQIHMKDIHYTMLKSTGCFFGMLAPFSLGVVVFLPHDPLNWFVVSVICLIFAGILVSYCFIWKHVCTYQHDYRHLNRYPIHWSRFLLILIPLSMVLPPNLPLWAQTPFRYACLFVLGVLLTIAFTRFISQRKESLLPGS